ncbi:hypothetical protein JX265_009493 [Neoarthrinium moseri]|uniref:Uncharacterized protein n=1 Tax=Neoarthrinium moseri TaxID=1658444 RepID=A0A9P9WFM8_9PEZI|nr:hypothetical protein JX265_009493 [Neoarthrinium moseri]
MTLEVKELPPLPEGNSHAPGRGPPLPLKSRKLITKELATEPDRQLQKLRKECIRLRQKIDHLEGEKSEKEVQIQDLLSQNESYRLELVEQKRLVGRVAETITLAFRDFQEITDQNHKRHVHSPPSQASPTADIYIAYEEMVSTWSDSSRE